MDVDVRCWIGGRYGYYVRKTTIVLRFFTRDSYGHRLAFRSCFIFYVTLSLTVIPFHLMGVDNCFQSSYTTPAHALARDDVFKLACNLLVIRASRHRESKDQIITWMLPTYVLCEKKDLRKVSLPCSCQIEINEGFKGRIIDLDVVSGMWIMESSSLIQKTETIMISEMLHLDLTVCSLAAEASSRYVKFLQIVMNWIESRENAQ